jgi:hypothetical protein
MAEEFFSVLKKYRREDFGYKDIQSEFVVEFSYPECKKINNFYKDLIEYSERTGEPFPLKKRLEEERAEMRDVIYNRILLDIEVAYNVSRRDFDEIANNTLHKYSSLNPRINEPELIDFLLEEFGEEFNKALRKAPKERWSNGELFSYKHGSGKGSGDYDPLLDFRFVDLPETLELETPYMLRACKWPKNFDPNKILIRFTKSIAMMKWS